MHFCFMKELLFLLDTMSCSVGMVAGPTKYSRSQMILITFNFVKLFFFTAAEARRVSKIQRDALTSPVKFLYFYLCPPQHHHHSNSACKIESCLVALWLCRACLQWLFFFRSDVLVYVCVFQEEGRESWCMGDVLACESVRFYKVQWAWL